MRTYKLTNSAVDYALRNWILNKDLTNASANEIGKFFEEADVVKNALARFLNSQNTQQRIIRRLDSPITSAILRALESKIVVETSVSKGMVYYILHLKSVRKNCPPRSE